jgi:hypothetical protein
MPLGREWARENTKPYKYRIVLDYQLKGHFIVCGVSFRVSLNGIELRLEIC